MIDWKFVAGYVHMLRQDYFVSDIPCVFYRKE
jgi:hypothetical protein